MASLPPVNGRAAWLHRLCVGGGPPFTPRALHKFTLGPVAHAVYPAASPKSPFPALRLDFLSGFAVAIVDRVLRKVYNEFCSSVALVTPPIATSHVHQEVLMFLVTALSMRLVPTLNRDLEPQLRPKIRAATPGTSVDAPKPPRPYKRMRNPTGGSDDDGAIVLTSTMAWTRTCWWTSRSSASRALWTRCWGSTSTSSSPALHQRRCRPQCTRRACRTPSRGALWPRSSRVMRPTSRASTVWSRPSARGTSCPWTRTALWP